MTTAVSGIRRDVRVLGLISAGHMMSHFYVVCLPPLFLAIQQHYALSFVEIGLILTVFKAAAAVAQLPVGFLVDRIGARTILIVGLVMEAGGIGAMAFAPNLTVLLGLAALAGLGHSVFHPADYAIMTSSVDQSRLGRAFGVHLFAGETGSAAAPIMMGVIASLWSWQAGLLTASAIGLAIALCMFSQSHVLNDHVVPRQKSKSDKASVQQGSSLAALLSPPVLILFLFFMTTTIVTSGLASFTVVLLAKLHETPVALANVALTAYLAAAAAGVLAGGWLSDRTRRHDFIATLAFLATAALLIAIAEIDLPILPIMGVFVAIGILQGVVKPARDMMVNQITPKGTSGSVFAFMSTGRLIGGTATPVLIGWMIDSGLHGGVFWAMAGVMLVAIATLYMPRRAAV